MNKFVAFYAADFDMYFCETYEEAEKWLMDKIAADGLEDGFAEETVHGKDFIAELISRVKYVEDDKKENYHEHTDECSEDCDEEEWGYGADFDMVGHVELVPANPNRISYS